MRGARPAECAPRDRGPALSRRRPHRRLPLRSGRAGTRAHLPYVGGVQLRPRRARCRRRLPVLHPALDLGLAVAAGRARVGRPLRRRGRRDPGTSDPGPGRGPGGHDHRGDHWAAAVHPGLPVLAIRRRTPGVTRLPAHRHGPDHRGCERQLGPGHQLRRGYRQPGRAVPAAAPDPPGYRHARGRRLARLTRPGRYEPGRRPHRLMGHRIVIRRAYRHPDHTEHPRDGCLPAQRSGGPGLRGRGYRSVHQSSLDLRRGAVHRRAGGDLRQVPDEAAADRAPQCHPLPGSDRGHACDTETQAASRDGPIRRGGDPQAVGRGPAGAADGIRGRGRRIAGHPRTRRHPDLGLHVGAGAGHPVPVAVAADPDLGTDLPGPRGVRRRRGGDVQQAGGSRQRDRPVRRTRRRHRGRRPLARGSHRGRSDRPCGCRASTWRWPRSGSAS
jgi:hypothetical protein